jgi:flagellar biogenesis protein FliO
MILGGVAWYMRRRRGRRGGSGSIRSIDVVAAKRIGPKQSILLVEAGGQTLLVGSTEKGMTRLATLGDESTHETNDVQIDDDEEIALPRLKNSGRRELTPLERELRRPMNGEKTTSTFKKELESEGARLSGWANLLASRSPKSSRTPIEAPPNSSTAAVEGLLRLRQMADDSTPMIHHGQRTNGRAKGHANGTKPNGKDMNIAALESLLTSRPAN